MGDRRSTASSIKSRVNMRPFKLRNLGLLSLLGVLTAAAPARAASAPAVVAEVPAVVTLSDQRVRLDDTAHTLVVEVMVHNALDVDLTSVELGWLLAPDVQALAAVTDPGALYLDADDPKRATAPEGVTVLRHDVRVAVPARGKSLASLAVPLGANASQVYRTHVLGYTLADASLALLLRLLNGNAAADERAAVDFFALASPAAARLAARSRLLANDPLATELWLRALEPLLVAPVRERPSASELHERLFVTRAVGVIGGARAEQLLVSAREQADLARFDELLRVVLIDRLRGTRLETPLAFAVPQSARTFRDVVDVALADCREPIAEGRLPTADNRGTVADGRLPGADSRLPIADGRARDAVEGDVVSESLLNRWWVHATGLAVVVAASMVMTLFLRRKL